MPSRIIIVRHGETDSNKLRIVQGHLDVPLNSTGLTQATTAAKFLEKYQIDVIFSSDLKRAYVTAKHTAKRHKLPIHKTVLLRERYFGTLQGKSFADITKKVDAEFSHFSQVVRGKEHEYVAESDSEILERVKKFQAYLDLHRNKTVVVFTHGGLIARLLEHLLKLSREEVDQMSFPNAKPIVLMKCNGRYTLE